MENGYLDEAPKSENFFDAALRKARLTTTQAAGGFSFCLALLIAISILIQKEPAGFAYIALLVFGAVPVVLMLKPELSSLALRTPKGLFAIEANNAANLVSSLESVIAKGTEDVAVEQVPSVTKSQIGDEKPRQQDAQDEQERPMGAAEDRPQSASAGYGGYGAAGAYGSSGAYATLGHHWIHPVIASDSWVRIAEIGERDAFKLNENHYVGMIGQAVGPMTPSPFGPGYLQGTVEIKTSNGDSRRLIFIAVKVEPLYVPPPSNSTTTPSPS